MEEQTIIKIKNLKKYFGRVKAVDGISFDIKKGEIFGFLGPNGAGKTTTIHTVMDFLRPDSGTIEVFGLNSKKKSTIIKERVGYLPADVQLYPDWTGEEHIDFLEKIKGKKSIAKTLCQKLDFDPKVKFRTLSSGNKQKLGLVLALMFEPELLVLDEPTAGLDPILQNVFYNILTEFKKKGITIFMSSHNLPEVERICEKVAIIKQGKLLVVEDIHELEGKKMHLVTVRFDGKFNKSDFNFDGAEVKEEIAEGLIIKVGGDINPLLKKLTGYKIKDLEITHASLEEVFLEYYEKGTK